MDLDVVVVTFNSAAHVGSALAPLPPEAHVVVVDNGSQDTTVENARAAGVPVVVNDINAGFAAGANQGARLGSAPFILFLNPDGSVAPDQLQVLADAMDSDAGLGVVAPRLRRPDGSEGRATWPYPSARAAWIEALGLHRFGLDRRDGGFVIGACFLVRRAAFEALGGFDERFWLYAEETDFCHRAEQAGWGIAQVDGAWAEHVGGASGESAPRLVREHFYRGSSHFVAKHEGPAAVLSLRAAHVTGSLVRLALPGAGVRRKAHRARLRWSVAALRTHPLSVALDSPVTRAPGNGIVVCLLEPWDDVWRRNQFFVREILEREPHRRVLFVEPPFDWAHELRHRSARRRQRGLRPLVADGRIIRLEPAKVWPRRLGALADRSLRRQVRRAADELGMVEPELWVNDSSYAGLAAEMHWPAVYDITDE